MKLYRLTDRIWVYPFEPERDRPNLCYIRGDRLSLAVDAGHSDDHVREFYRELENEGLKKPDMTVLTHWHWDHTLGMHAVHGVTIANEKTDGYLRAFRERLAREGSGWFLAPEESIRNEYAGGKPVIVTLPDMVFTGEMNIELGGCPVRLLRSEASHTDDSTLVYAVNERVLFIGDAYCGSYPSWKHDPVLDRRLAETIGATGAATCLSGHCEAQTKEEVLADLARER